MTHREKVLTAGASGTAGNEAQVERQVGPHHLEPQAEMHFDLFPWQPSFTRTPNAGPTPCMCAAHSRMTTLISAAHKPPDERHQKALLPAPCCSSAPETLEPREEVPDTRHSWRAVR